MPKKILFIDDDPDIVLVTQFILEDAGFKVLTGDSAEVGLAILEKEIPDLILMDLALPKMQGWELSKKLKSEDRYKDILIILFTANAGINKKSVNEMGGDDFIIKPYEHDLFLKKVTTWLNKK